MRKKANGLIASSSSSSTSYGWREGDKERLLETANALAIAGTVFLAAAMAAGVFLIADVLYGGWQAAAAAGGVAGLLAWFWLGLPLSRRARDG